MYSSEKRNMNLHVLLYISVLLLYQLHMGLSHEIPENEQVVVQSINQFSKKLYQVLIGEDDNLVLSPFSVETALAMLNLGLQENTERRVNQALFLPETRSQWTSGFKSLLSTLQGSQDVVLDIANKIYIQGDFDVKEKFKNDTEEYFNSVTEEVDFAHKPEEVRVSINNWVAEKTHEKIKDLLAPGSLKANVVMLLLNAIYFKGMWETPFRKHLTSDRPFYSNLDSQKNVSTMILLSDLPYTELQDLNVQVVKLPYTGGKFCMLIFLPKERNGLSNLESNLEQLNVPQIMSTMDSRPMTVAVPRFKILTTTDLNLPLSQMDLGELMNGKGNFSGISNGSIYVSKALQKAFIEVNEEGTEAAVVTGLGVNFRSGVRRQSFNADHPFLCMIVEEEKGTILIMARVKDPEE